LVLEYSSKVVSNGLGDVTYKSQRNILGTILSERKISYSLFNIEYNTFNKSCSMKLLRKLKLHSKYDISALV